MQAELEATAAEAAARIRAMDPDLAGTRSLLHIHSTCSLLHTPMTAPVLYYTHTHFTTRKLSLLHTIFTTPHPNAGGARGDGSGGSRAHPRDGPRPRRHPHGLRTRPHLPPIRVSVVQQQGGQLFSNKGVSNKGVGCSAIRESGSRAHPRHGPRPRRHPHGFRAPPPLCYIYI